VAVRQRAETYEITTFRSEHDYADFRRPHRVEFGDAIEVDLARRDFTVNAMAWGGRPGEELALVDPYDGRADVEAHRLRAVGDPDRRFSEDALRMVRAVRLAATLEFTIEPATLEAIGRHAGLVRHLSGERIAGELVKLLAADRPSVGLRLAEETGVLTQISPELALQRGIAQNKLAGEDLWDHTLRTVDATLADRPIVRLAALLHDIGKPATASDGPFLGHETVGADLVEELLRRLRFPRETIDRVRHLVRHHMFAYEPGWSDAAVRRFLGKIGSPEIDELFALRAADNVGSGRPDDAGGLPELRRRVAAEIAADVALELRDLAIDGDDLIAELGLEPGPTIGRILDELLEQVVADPALNDRPTLLVLAQRMLADDR
jgi:putative nucleotidyltransferase with HDIG domain